MSEFQPPDLPRMDEHPCAMTDGTFDHDWYYDAGDPDTGVNPAYVCKVCGEVDCNPGTTERG